eukprot:SAG22_NODE_11879_length_465_cov_0.983607_1_plen_85_part_10
MRRTWITVALGTEPLLQTVTAQDSAIRDGTCNAAACRHTKPDRSKDEYPSPAPKLNSGRDDATSRYAAYVRDSAPKLPGPPGPLS